MTHPMPPEIESVQKEPDSRPAVSVRIGGAHFEMDRVPHLPRWLTTIVTSAAVLAGAYLTHHLASWG